MEGTALDQNNYSAKMKDYKKEQDTTKKKTKEQKTSVDISRCVY